MCIRTAQASPKGFRLRQGYAPTGCRGPDSGIYATLRQAKAPQYDLPGLRGKLWTRRGVYFYRIRFSGFRIVELGMSPFPVT